jgi:hypothetical protein
MPKGVIAGVFVGLEVFPPPPSPAAAWVAKQNKKSTPPPPPPSRRFTKPQTQTHPPAIFVLKPETLLYFERMRITKTTPLSGGLKRVHGMDLQETPVASGMEHRLGLRPRACATTVGHWSPANGESTPLSRPKGLFRRAAGSSGCAWT